jgi:hypothetical protein
MVREGQPLFQSRAPAAVLTSLPQYPGLVTLKKSQPKTVRRARIHGGRTLIEIHLSLGSWHGR